MTIRVALAVTWLAVTWLAVTAVSVAGQAPVTPPTAAWSIAAGERVLIVSPHPDDEVLCCAGFAQRALAAGASVSVVWVTSGDAFELDAALVEHRLIPGHKSMLKLAATRMQEAAAAMQRLGIDGEHRYFLGYPDRGLHWLLTDYYARPYTSRYTGVAAVPYDVALSPGAAYEGRLLERDLVAVIERVQPTLILAPSTQDRHPDHAATGEWLLRVLPGIEARAGIDTRTGNAARTAMRFWIVHAGHHWPSPRRLQPEAPLLAPRLVDDPGWISWPLTPGERDTKLAALRLYRSQWRIMEPFVASFVRSNELFTENGRPAPSPVQRQIPRR